MTVSSSLYYLSLHDALPISFQRQGHKQAHAGRLKAFHGVQVKGSGFDHIGQTELDRTTAPGIPVAVENAHTAIAQPLVKNRFLQRFALKVSTGRSHHVDDQQLLDRKSTRLN